MPKKQKNKTHKRSQPKVALGLNQHLDHVVIVASFLFSTFGQTSEVCQAFYTRVILCLINRQPLTCGWFQ